MKALPGGGSAFGWAVALAALPALIALGLGTEYPPQAILIGGLLLSGALLAINPSLHRYSIVSYAQDDGVSLDVGLCHISNARGGLVGALLSGWVFQAYGLEACLWYQPPSSHWPH